MKSYRSSSTFVTVDLLFHELLPFVQNSFSGFFLGRNNGLRFEFVGAGGGPVLLLAILSVCLFFSVIIGVFVKGLSQVT